MRVLDLSIQLFSAVVGAYLIKKAYDRLKGSPFDDSVENDEIIAENTSICDNKVVLNTNRIPKSYKSGLIGNKGMKIENIKSETNTTIRIVDNDDGECSINISGLEKNVYRALELINTNYKTLQNHKTMKRYIPSYSVSAILGKRGSMIASIEQSTNTRIQLHSGLNDHLIISGGQKDIDEASSMIDKIIAEVEERRLNSIYKIRYNHGNK